MGSAAQDRRGVRVPRTRRAGLPPGVEADVRAVPAVDGGRRTAPERVDRAVAMMFAFARGDEVHLRARPESGIGVVNRRPHSGSEPQYKVRFNYGAHVYRRDTSSWRGMTGGRRT